jgi:two-component system, NarL family, nitrate/nitrite response regulator NarL
MHGTEKKIIRLLIVDDHSLFREAVARLLASEPGFQVVAHCGSGKEAVRILRSARDIDVLLLDLDLGQERGTELLDWLQTSHFGGRVVLVTASVSDREVPSLIQKGVAGVFMKHGPPASLIQGIRDAMEGKALFEGELLRRAFQQTPRLFTERERLILSFVFEGFANKQIADRLQISENVVKSSLQQLFAKTGVRTRSQLVRIVLERYRSQL